MTTSGSEIDAFAAPGPETYTLSAPPSAWPTTPLRARVRFERGVVTHLDGQAIEGPEMLRRLNATFGAYGVGRGIYTGDTTIGLKGRIVFECPGLVALLTAHRALEEAVLTAHQNAFKPVVAQKWVELVYKGFFFEPLKRDLEALLRSSQAFVSGEVTVETQGGVCHAVEVVSDHVLLNRKAVYAQSADWSAAEAEGFIKLFGQSSTLSARVNPVVVGARHPGRSLRWRRRSPRSSRCSSASSRSTPGTRRGPSGRAASSRASRRRSGPAFACAATDLGDGCVSLLAVRGAPRRLFNVHVDTVPADPGWTADPLRLRVEGDRAVGLGAADVKGAAACLAVAARRTRRRGRAALHVGRGGGVERAACAASSTDHATRASSSPSPRGAARSWRTAGSPPARAPSTAWAGTRRRRARSRTAPLHEAVRWASRALAFAEASEARRYGGLAGIRFNLGAIQGGTKANMIAAEAALRFGVRPLPDQRPEQLCAAITGLAPRADRVTWRPGFVAPPLPAPGRAVEEAAALAARPRPRPGRAGRLLDRGGPLLGGGHARRRLRPRRHRGGAHGGRVGAPRGARRGGGRVRADPGRLRRARSIQSSSRSGGTTVTTVSGSSSAAMSSSKVLSAVGSSSIESSGGGGTDPGARAAGGGAARRAA